MELCELINGGATKSAQQAFLADGETVAVAIRIPSNLRDSAKEIASLCGMSFSAFVRMCMIERLTAEVSNE